MKKCNKCNENKELTEYHKHKRTNDGVTTICKICVSIYAKSKYLENPEKVKQRNKKWVNNNKELHAEYNYNYKKQKNQENPEK